ncbi:MAG: LacI family DNA-binding transcriptional regulator [Devosia sp.]|nr:LacI family DNA-binding transcriptional regulator [Devosia sp.]
MAKAIVRLKDIADKTGFSTNTVSLALRDSPRIPPETRNIIRSAALELNYLPNHIAKSLVSRSTMTIGLVLTEITNPILTETAQAIELALAERGYGTLFATSNNTYADELRAVELFRSRQVDGILIYPTSPRRLDHIRPLRRANIPVVMLTGDPDGTIDAVCVDDKRGAYKATRHLIETGHKRIGIIDGGTKRGNPDKLDGYQQALRESGIEPDPALQVEPSENSLMGGYWAMDPLMNAPARPTAVFAVTDSLAIGALRWCQKHGLKVPDDIAIMGCDNIDFAEYAAVPLSSVNYAVEVVSRMAVDRLMRLISAGDHLPEPRATLIEPELVIRESTRGRRGSEGN